MLKIAINKGFLITPALEQGSILANGFLLFVSKKGETKSVAALKFKDVTRLISFLGLMKYF